MEVRAALEEYLEVKRRYIKPKTLGEKRRILSSFSSFCEKQEVQLEQIKPKVVDSYLDTFQSTHHSKTGGPLSSQTVFLLVAHIKIFLRWCSASEEFEDCIKPAAIQRIPNPRKTTAILDTFTKEQIVNLLEACEVVDVGIESINAYLRDRNRAIILLLLDTGIRAAELCGLRMKDVCLDRDDPHIRIYGKNSKWRECGLGNRTREELTRFVRKYRAKEKGSESMLFLTRRGDPLTEGTLFRVVKQLGREAHIKGVRCSGDIYRLSKLLGHSSVKITENYLRSFTQQDARQGAVHPADQEDF